MSAHVLLNLLNELGKRDKILSFFYFFFATSFINSIIQEYKVTVTPYRTRNRQ